MKKISDNEKWELLAEKSPSASADSVNDLGVAYMAEVVAQLSSDAAADVLRVLPQDFASSVLLEIQPEKAADIREILSHPAGTAGALMAKEYLYIPASMTIADAIEFLHLIPRGRKGKVPYVYVLDQAKKLAGVVQTKDLIFNPLDTPVSDIMNSSAVTVSRATTQQEMAKIFRDQRYLALPVVDDEKRLVGIVSADNLLNAIQEQADKDIAQLVGTSAEELKSHSVPTIMRLRLPWLSVNLISGLLCAFISGVFEQGAGAATVLFLFVPVVLGLSESTGIQGATIVVRNLTLGTIRFKDFKPLFVREVAVGLCIGVICGVVVGIVTSLWQGNALLGLAIGLAMNVAIVFSALIGLMMPAAFKALKIDPAIASGPLVLAVCDIQTLAVYFSLASYILRR